MLVYFVQHCIRYNNNLCCYPPPSLVIDLSFPSLGKLWEKGGWEKEKKMHTELIVQKKNRKHLSGLSLTGNVTCTCGFFFLVALDLTTIFAPHGLDS